MSASRTRPPQEARTAVSETTDSIAPLADMLPWWDRLDLDNPRDAFMRGLMIGIEIGRGDHEWPPAPLRGFAAGHERAMRARAARAEADDTTPRPGDFMGRVAA